MSTSLAEPIHFGPQSRQEAAASLPANSVAANRWACLPAVHIYMDTEADRRTDWKQQQHLADKIIRQPGAREKSTRQDEIFLKANSETSFGVVGSFFFPQFISGVSRGHILLLDGRAVIKWRPLDTERGGEHAFNLLL